MWRRKIQIIAAVSFLIILFCADSVYAETDENVEMVQTGWVRGKNTGWWYYLDEKTGKEPDIDEVAACHLLENALKKADLYQNEDGPVIFKVVEVTEKTISVLVAEETGPDSYMGINTYQINRKNGKAKAVVGDDLNLFEYFYKEGA